jgi:SAM-dependent methyltransferase
MAHNAQRQFCHSVKQAYPDRFRDRKVLDVGSYDINGTSRPLFESSRYLGIDLIPGPNVDLVIRAHDFHAPSGTFDFIISTEMLEHDMHYERTLPNLARLLRPGGTLLFTCATTGRREHGTLASKPADSPGTVSRGGAWSRYYRTLSEDDVRRVLDVDRVFAEHQFAVNKSMMDLYFWGFKRPEGC